MTNKQIGLKFKILEEKDEETVYLGDLIGNEVTENQRLDKHIEKIRKKGERWNREQITVYGRALVCNTLMMPVILYRTRVNGLTKEKEKKIEQIKDMIWKDMRPVKWSKVIRPIEEGGLGLKDPGTHYHDTRHEKREEEKPTLG